MIRLALRLSVCANAAQRVDVADQTKDDEKSGDKIVGAHAYITMARTVPIAAPTVVHRNMMLIR
jgi:hypothetical protein